jgi:hypothetical protein
MPPAVSVLGGVKMFVMAGKLNAPALPMMASVKSVLLLGIASLFTQTNYLNRYQVLNINNNNNAPNWLD